MSDFMKSFICFLVCSAFVIVLGVFQYHYMIDFCEKNKGQTVISFGWNVSCVLPKESTHDE